MTFDINKRFKRRDGKTILWGPFLHANAHFIYGYESPSGFGDFEIVLRNGLSKDYLENPEDLINETEYEYEYAEVYWSPSGHIVISDEWFSYQQKTGSFTRIGHRRRIKGDNSAIEWVGLE